MATQKGTKGAVFGIPGTSGLVLVCGGVTFQIVRTYNYSKESDSKTIAGLTGDVVNLTFYNGREKLSVDLICTGTLMSDAMTVFNGLPAQGALAEITSASGDTQVVTAGDTTNDWIVETASKVAVQDDFATVTLGLVRYATDLDAINS